MESNVVELDLSFNAISIIENSSNASNSSNSNCKISMENLQRLYLNKNKIQDIPAVFSTFRKLQILDIRDNPLNTISPCTMHLNNYKF